MTLNYARDEDSRGVLISAPGDVRTCHSLPKCKGCDQTVHGPLILLGSFIGFSDGEGMVEMNLGEARGLTVYCEECAEQRGWIGQPMPLCTFPEE